MKCDVLFSKGSVSTLFRWGGPVFRVCVKMLSYLQQCKIIFLKSNEFLQSYELMITNVLPLFMNHSV